MTSSDKAVAAWRDFCERVAEVGAAALGDPVAATARDHAEGLRWLSRQLVFALQYSFEFSDSDFPALYRFNDDVTKWGGPNADNHYLRCAIDPGGTYRLTADVEGCRDAIFSLGDGDMHDGRYGIFSECALGDLEVIDGRLELIIGPSEPRTGPKNWLPTNPDVCYLMIRVYVSDWLKDTIGCFYIERLDRSVDRPRQLTLQRASGFVSEAARWLEAAVPYWMHFLPRRRANGADNVLIPPRRAPGGADNIAYGGGYWNLDTSQCWLITFEPPTGGHWSIQTCTWPWFESGDLAHAQTSLNETQAHADPDGRVRVVISHVDPVAPNWIDTEGRRVGMCLYRWIEATELTAAQAEIVELEELRNFLPADHPVVTPAERRNQLDTRRRGIHRRFRH